MKNINEIYTKKDIAGYWIAVHDGTSWIIDCIPQSGHYTGMPQRVDEPDGAEWRLNRSSKRWYQSSETMDRMYLKEGVQGA